MAKWRRSLRKLRKLLRKRDLGPRPVPLAGSEVAGSQSHLRTLLSSRAPSKAPGDGSILVAEEGSAALAVEGCMAIPGGGIAVRGWLADPHGQIAGLWLEIDGAFRPASFDRFMYRSDVLEQRGLIEAFPGLHTGWSLFEPCEVDPGKDVVVSLHAITQTPNGFIVLSSGVTVMPGQRCSLDRLANEFRAGCAAPVTIAAAAEPFLNGLASVKRPVAWRESRIEAASSGPADLSVVIIVNDNAEVLDQLLAALEASGHASNMEVILALRTPKIEPAVTQCVRAWRGSSPFAGIRTLVPIGAVGFGLAATAGIGFAQGQAIAVASDEVLPPNGNWVGTALKLLGQDPQSVFIPAIATFDHRPFTLASAFDVPLSEFEHDHSALRDVAAFETVQEGFKWSCGFLIADRDLLQSAGGFDDSLIDMDICLLEFVLRTEFDALARLKPLPGAFTHLRLPAYDAGDPVERLWSLYALAGSIRRRCEAKPCGTETRKAAPSEPRARPRLAPA